MNRRNLLSLLGMSPVLLAGATAEAKTKTNKAAGPALQS